MKPLLALCAALGLLLVLPVSFHAGEVSIQLPPETAVLKPGAGAELAQGNCLICHSADYIQYQPPMPRKFWEAEVKKMQAKYGAPISDELLPAVIDYLTKTYGTTTPQSPPSAAATPQTPKKP
jgi:sulfite dehydrogenase (cytochrome) subunit B